MNKKIKKIACLVVLALLFVPCIVIYADSTLDKLNDAKDAEKKLEKRLDDTKKKISSLKSEMTSLENFINQLDEQIEELTGEIVDLNQQIDDKNIEIDNTKVELEEAKAVEKHQYESMKLRIQFMYEHQEENYLDMIFNSASLEDVLNKAEYVTKVSEYDRKMLDEYVAIKEKVMATLEKLEMEEAELEVLKLEVQGRLDETQLLLDAKNEEMDALEASKEEYEKQQAQVENDIKSLDKLIDDLTAQYNQEQLAKAGATATKENLYAKKLLLWPCPSSRRITSDFSPARVNPVTGRLEAHRGTDIGAPTGTPVVAAASGLVTAAGYNSSMGNYVVISHGDGITTRYYHNSRLAVSQGTSVKAGQVISYVGATGQATGPHLHFEVRVDGNALNAMQFY